ncbi:MAG TPA: acetate/propionate family kinase [Gemmatimonadales bacterium]|nr:acetate/propionate family kinase [Gemmatimonadales bacterium]
MRVLVINCGSATLKYKLFDERAGEPHVLAGATTEIPGGNGYRDAVAQAVAALPCSPDVIAHRVVHAGGRLPEVVRIDEAVLRILREVTPLAPLHNGPALEGIEATLEMRLPLVAALDTAFHATLPARAWRYAVPEHAGVRRYGFHGWSHRSVTEHYAAIAGSPEPTIITLHLGGGCSAAAILHGRSVDTSMGYSPLEGLVMGTRAGDLDPAILTHLLRDGMSVTQLEQMLNHEAGLKALAGTGDVRELLRRHDPAAVFALDVFCYHVQKYVGAYLAVLEGAEAVVFTGGIGEHAPEIRRRICQGFGWAGLTLDAERNHGHGPRISTDDSRLAAYVIPTDEERLIARETLRLLRAAGAA